MESQMTKIENCELGMVGLGVMGRNLLLDMADHGHTVAGYDKDPDKVEALRRESRKRSVGAADNLNGLIAMLGKPRTVMLLVPAGKIVDQVIKELERLLDADDLIIDGGNSHFTDTDRRAQAVEKSGFHYIGMGVSGGSHGARRGPSMMPGGPREAYARVQSLLEDVAAHVDGDPCVTYLGPRSAGHYVKMIHNGIEYGVMQMIAETYDIMKRGLGLGNDQLQDVYRKWNQTELSGFLIEITADIFGHIDEDSGKHLVDVILDQAKQKGTGMWASQDAMELQSCTPTIDAAVGARDLSSLADQRRDVGGRYSGPRASFPEDPAAWVPRLRDALYAGMIIAYAQGLALLRRASDQYRYNVSLEDVARIWRGGCIIRAALLHDIRDAFRANPKLSSLLLDEHLGNQLRKRQDALRAVAAQALQAGIPAPALSASLAYFDGLRSEHLPANLIQAQRDYFGAHTYERVDREGTVHTHWRQD
jgi:6-phosphogluconate dehydrogenase